MTAVSTGLAIYHQSGDLKRLAIVFEERKEKVSDKDFPPLSVTKNGILPQLDSAAKSDDGDNRKGVRQGDFVINSRSDRKGSSGVAKQDGSVSLINIVLQPKGIDPQYCEHLLKSNGFIEEFYRNGHGIVADLWTTRYWDMKSIHIPLPDMSTQKRIANFLDQKTAEIDESIAKKQRLIELLKEQKSLLINQVITKGLKPDVPMRDSGVEWIGEIPAHWKVLPFKRTIKSICDGPFGSSLTSSHYAEEGARVIRLQNIGPVNFIDNDQAYIPLKHYETLKKHSVVPGDLLIAGLGDENKTVGRACVYNGQDNFAIVKADCFRARVDERIVSAQYVACYMSSRTGATGCMSSSRGTTRSRINLEITKILPIVMPPMEEQILISERVNMLNIQYATAKKKVAIHISMLLELKHTLVANAVTGKIKL